MLPARHDPPEIGRDSIFVRSRSLRAPPRFNVRFVGLRSRHLIRRRFHPPLTIDYEKRLFGVTDHDLHLFALSEGIYGLLDFF